MKNLKTLFNSNLDLEINNVKINSKDVEKGDFYEKINYRNCWQTR